VSIPPTSAASGQFIPSDPITGEDFLVALDFADRGDTVDNDAYCQIGDSVFHIPPTSITVNEMSNNRSEDVIRTAGGIVMANGFVEREITFEIMFTDVEAVFGLPSSYSQATVDRRISSTSANSGGGLGWLGAPVHSGSLAALIAQFKRTPILPVSNKLVNYVFQVGTVALEGLTVMTHMNERGLPVPGVMRALLRCKAFQTHSFCPTITFLGDAFIWPLQRWFWRQEYGERVPGEYAIFSPDSDAPYPIRPHESGMSGQFQFSTVSQEWINAVATLRNEFNSRLQESLTTQFRIGVSEANQVRWQQELAALLEQIKDLSEESTAKMNPVFLGNDVQLTQVTAQVVNNLTALRIPDLETPAYQHMGQGDVRIVATFTVTSDESLDMLRRMVSESRRIARESRFEVIAGFVGFENEIASLMGVHAVVFTDVQVQTVPNFPHTFIVAIEMLGFDRFQRRLESVQQAANTPLYYLDQNAVAFGPEETMGDVTDPRYIFWQRNVKTKNAKTSSVVPNGTDPDATSPQASLPGLDPIGRPVNAWFNMAYIEQASEQMQALELYPDLQLPAWSRLKLALTTNEIFSDPSEQEAQLWMQQIRWQNWGAEGKYVDPDFYIDYPNKKVMEAIGLKDGVPQPNQTLSFLGQAIADGDTSKLNAGDLMLFVDGSISEKLHTSLYDSYPQMAMYGPTLTGNPINQAGDAGVPKGHTHRHAAFNVPTPNASGSGLPVHTFTAPEIQNDSCTINGDNYLITHPADGAKDPLHDLLAFRKIMQQGPTLTDAINEAQKNVTQGELNQALLMHHPTDVGFSPADEHNRLLSMCTDLFEHDATGRLIQSFPSYVFQLIDEGPRMSWTKIFPNFYALQAITSIDVIQDRREPADTAVIEMMNTYGNLSSYSALQLAMAGWIAMDRSSLFGIPMVNQLIGDLGSAVEGNKTGGGWSALWEDLTQNNLIHDGLEELISPFYTTRGKIKNTVALRNQQSAALMIAPGVRVHIRAGYGANGAILPILFNGRITDVGYGEKMRVIALGDGIELDNLIPTAESETNSINRPDRGFAQTGVPELFSAGASLLNGDIKGSWDHISKAFSMALEQTYEPREIICNLLNSHGEELYDYGLGAKFWNVIKTGVRASFNGAFFADNPMGISHFGNPYIFTYWNALASKNLDTYGDSDASQAAQGGVDVPLYTQLTSYANAIKAAPPATSKPLTKVEKIAQLGAALIPGEVGATLGVTSAAISHGMSNLQFALVGAASLFKHWIPTAAGETGENVYSIFTPFSKISKEAGSFFGAQSFKWFLDPTGAESSLEAAKTIALQNADGTTAAANYPTLPDTGQNYAGMHMPGCSFNMYTKNKKAWDVVTTLAQYFPPYIAAVRPFEYRSTLFFGAPYFQYRFGYKRISAYDLGQYGDDSLDFYYGYPVAYKTKTFLQMRYYDSAVNLLENEIRASDEETYTDVVAMWYKGQGYSGERPTPIPTHQTVDRMITPAVRKTAIVNTDILGLDTAPSKSAVLGSFGGALVGYWAEHFIQIPGTDIGVHGVANFFLTAQNMRQMARSLLRDYQRLMYQGRILVLGDPSAKPFDHMWIEDRYTDIRGPATIRRVIHHFGIESGFVTSIEPDLLCEVKGQDFMTGYWSWIGCVFTGLAVQYGAARALSAGRLEYLLSLGRVMLRATGAGRQYGQVKVVAGKAGSFIKGMPTRMFLTTFRDASLDALYNLIKLGKKSGGVDTMTETIIDTLKNGATDLGLGADAVDEASLAHTQALIYQILTDGTNITLDAVDKDIFGEVIVNNLTGTISADTLETIAKRIATEYFVTTGIWKFAEQSVTNLSVNTIERLGLNSFVGGLAQKLGATVGEQGLQGATKAGGAAIADIAGDFAGALGGKYIGAVIGGFIGGPIGAVVMQIAVSWLWTSVSNWWDDQTSLAMCPLSYRGIELSAGINGHAESIIIRAAKDNDELFTMSPGTFEVVRRSGIIQPSQQAQDAVGYLATKSNAVETGPTTSGSPSQAGAATAGTVPTPPIVKGGIGTPVKNYSGAQRLVIARFHGGYGKGGGFTTDMNQFIVNDGTGVTDSLVRLFEIFMQNNLRCDVSCFKSGQHSSTSDHYVGRAADIVWVNGEVAGNTLGPQFQRLYAVLQTCPNLHQIGIDAATDPTPVIGHPWRSPYGGAWEQYAIGANQMTVFRDDGSGPHTHISVTA
jgi:hypothetical protein